jgi:hypothetical protein
MGTTFVCSPASASSQQVGQQGITCEERWNGHDAFSVSLSLSLSLSLYHHVDIRSDQIMTKTLV